MIDKKPRRKKRKLDRNKPIIGACEYLALPRIGLPRIKARVDTGARTSALHAEQIEEFVKEGQTWIRFVSHIGDTTHSPEHMAECPVADIRHVKNTGGIPERRYVIRTAFCLGEHEWLCDVTLTDRAQMRFPMLLGRIAIKGRFLVDPDHVFLHGKRNSKRIRS